MDSYRPHKHPKSWLPPLPSADVASPHVTKSLDSSPKSPEGMGHSEPRAHHPLSREIDNGDSMTSQGEPEGGSGKPDISTNLDDQVSSSIHFSPHGPPTKLPSFLSGIRQASTLSNSQFPSANPEPPSKTPSQASLSSSKRKSKHTTRLSFSEPKGHHSPSPSNLSCGGTSPKPFVGLLAHDPADITQNPHHEPSHMSKPGDDDSQALIAPNEPAPKRKSHKRNISQELMGHTRSASTAAATALANLREHLHASGLVPKSLKRPKRRRSSLSEYSRLIQWRSDSTGSVWSVICEWFRQVEAIFRKHCLVAMFGSPILLLFAIAGPAIALMLATEATRTMSEAIGKVVFQTASDSLDGFTPMPLKLPTCTSSMYYCTPKIVYAPKTNQTAEIMENLSQILNLDSDRDVYGYSNLDTLIDGYYMSSREMQRRPRHYMVYFPPPSASPTENAPNTFYYTLGEGDNNPIGTFFDPILPRVYGLTKGTFIIMKTALDNAIINTFAREKQQININMATFPRIMPSEESNAFELSLVKSMNDSEKIRFEGVIAPKDQETATRKAIETLSHYASNVLNAPLIAAGSFPALASITGLLSQDKFNGNLSQLRHMNMFETAYWTATFIWAIFISALGAGFSLIPAHFFDFPAINQVEPSLLFLTIFLYTLATCVVCGMLVAVAIAVSPYATSITSVMIMALSSLFLLILNLTDLNQLFSGSGIVPWWDRFSPGIPPTDAKIFETSLYFIFSCFPFFHLGRIVGYMLDYTWGGPSGAGALSQAANASAVRNNPILPPGSNANAMEYPYALLTGVAINNATTTIAVSLIALSGLALIAVCLAWYVNQIASPTHRWRRSWHFIIPKLFCCRKKSKVPLADLDQVELKNVTQKFGKKQILDKISMKLTKGTVTALLGHNGSGKSTLLDILTGSAKPASCDETSHVFGYTLGTRPARAYMGFCPQGDIAWPALTAYEHIRLWARFRGIPGHMMRTYVNALLDIVGLKHEEILDRPVGKYSGGMLRRLSLLSACVGNPQLVIIDEGSNGLDPIHRRHVWEFIAMLAASGATVLLTSHNAQEVHALADDVVVLSVAHEDGGAQVVLHRNLLELRHEQSDIEIRVTLADPKNVENYFPSQVLLGSRVVASNAAVITLPRHKLNVIAYALESGVIADWELYSSFEFILPPQPGTDDLDSCFNDDSDDKEKDFESRNFLGGPVKKPYKPILVFHQVFGMFRKNLQLQLIANWRHNVIFLLLFIGAVIGLALLVTQSANSLCVSKYNSATKIQPGYFQFYDPFTKSMTCDLDIYTNQVKTRLLLCSPQNSTLCTIPDYAPIKQVQYQTYVQPQIWLSSPENMQSVLKRQTSVEMLQLSSNPVEQQRQSQSFAEVSGFDNPLAVFVPGLINRPVNMTFFDTTTNDWAQSVKEAQVSSVKNFSSDIPASCKRLIGIRKRNGIDGVPPLVANFAAAQTSVLTRYPDFTLKFAPQNGQPAKGYDLELRYWTPNRYPVAGFMFVEPSAPSGRNVNETCNVIEVLPSQDNLPPLEEDAQIFSQSSWPLTVLDHSKYRAEDLWLLDGPIRHMLSSASNSLARQIVSPNARIFGEYAKVYDLRFSLREELLMAALVCVLIWLFFPMFLRIPLAEQQGKFLAYYQVSGLSLGAYWASHYFFCLLYAFPFLLTLGIALKFLYPAINTGNLALTLLLSIHAIIGTTFLYAAIVVCLAGSGQQISSAIGASDKGSGGDVGGQDAMAMFIAYVVPLLIALPSVLFVYADVISLSVNFRTAYLAMPSIAIAFCLRIILQDFDQNYLFLCYMWLFGIGVICFLGCIMLFALSSVPWSTFSGLVKYYALYLPRKLNLVPNAKPKAKPHEPLPSKGVSQVFPSPKHVMETASVDSSRSDAHEATPSFVSNNQNESASGGHPCPTSSIANNSTAATTSTKTGINQANALAETFLPASKAISPPCGRITHYRQESMASIITVDSNVAKESERLANSADNNCIIKLQGVSKRYRQQKTPIVDGLSLGIEAHECFGLLGPSGCGKTHVVNLITKQMIPTSGTVSCNGTIGLCPQDNYLIAELSVMENLRFFAQVKGISFFSSSNRAIKVAKLVGLKPFLQVKAGSLSGGMRRRTMMAIALIANPSIVAADEPTTALDGMPLDSCLFSNFFFFALLAFFSGNAKWFVGDANDL
jgi:ABC-type multidrug transport system ATPase subunit